MIDVELTGPCVSKDGEIRAAFVASKDRVDVSYGSGASMASVWIIGDAEEACPFRQVSFLDNLFVKVVNDGYVESSGTRIDPVFAKLISMSGMDWLNGIAQSIKHTSELCERPTAFASGIAESLRPNLQVMSQRAKGDEGIVGGAATQDLGARMSDV